MKTPLKPTLLLLVAFVLSFASSARAGYDPTIGRWLSRDPLPDAEFSQGANLYAYVHNRPTDRADPLGLYESLNGLPGGVFPGWNVPDSNGYYGSPRDVGIAAAGLRLESSPPLRLPPLAGLSPRRT